MIIKVKQRVWVAFAIMAAAFAVASCDKNKNQQQAQKFDFEKPPESDRGLNQTELDSLRSMKITHHITRDDYWDMKGGVIANDRFEVWYSSRKIYVLQAIAVLKQMDQMADQIQKQFGRIPSEKLVVLCAPNLATFQKATGKDWWHYSLIKGDTLSMQTPMTLYMRQLLQVASRREYSRWAMQHFTQGKAPEWLTWGMAGYLGGERDVFRGQRKEYAKEPLRMDKVDEINNILRKDNDRIPARRAMYNAYLMVNQLIETHGMPSVAAFILAIPEEKDLDAAAQRVFSKSYDEVLAQAKAWTEPASEEEATP
ncbi:MAG TPA: hypothetical protein VFH33_05785 [Candidatus Krumholzibacteria bacterium]|nr:hypothetical protein [Candidatus Krumholzibacteria bacterium]